MNLAPSEAAAFARSLRERLPSLARTLVWVTPPTISAAAVVQELKGSRIQVGSQNVHWASSGAYTGETAAGFAKDLGLSFTLVGHSERRTLFGDTSESVAMRMRAALEVELTPVVCIGETEAERASGRTEDTLRAQLGPVFEQLDAPKAGQVILAYEPVWAIGTGKVASESEIKATHAFIKQEWDNRFKGTPCTVLYGGSVNPQNFAGIVSLPGVDGALVGGASIKVDQWLELVTIAEQAKK